MKTLAIQGHPTKGDKVIEILETLGGINLSKYFGNELSFIYYINEDKIINTKKVNSNLEGFLILTLDQFLEKCSCFENFVSIKNNILDDFHVFELEEYENDCKSKCEGSDTIHIKLNCSCYDKLDEVELILPDNWKFKQKDGKMFVVREQYPKTYEECSKILHTSCSRISTPGYKECQISLFQELLICRDAYWKIIGEEMGLSGSWNPDLTDVKQNKYAITNVYNEIKFELYGTYNGILVFPTKEIRDIFFENFKDLIEKCKEFL